MLSLLWEAIIGLIVGAIAKLLMPGKDPGGIWITMAIGIAGSIVATYLGQLVGWYQRDKQRDLSCRLLVRSCCCSLSLIRGMLAKS